MALMSWHFVTSEQYKAGVKSENALYWLSDTHEIYRGETPFTQSVVLYTELPTTSIATNRLYINSTTLEGKIWNGTVWTTVIKPVDSTVTVDGSNPVSGSAVASYVAAEIAKVTSGDGVISSLSWSSADHLLTVTKGSGATEDIVFDGLGVSLTYDSNTGKLQLSDASGNAIGTAINLDLERFVRSAEYLAESKTIVLYFDEEKQDKLTIPVADLVDTYTAEGDGKALSLTVENNVVKGSIKISTASGNTITADENGLYVAATDISGKMDKVAGAVEGNLAQFDADGNVVDSGKSVSDIVPNPSIFTGATVDEAVNGSTPKKGDICITINEIGTTGKHERIMYVYDGSSWVAGDENYNAENVYFAQDLITTSAVGNITLTNGQATIAAAGKNLKQVFDTIFVKEKNPTTTQPSVSVALTNAKAYEVGTTFTPSYTATLNAGSYTYGPATGITAKSWSVTDTDSHSATTNSGSFDSFTVGDSTNYSVSATATYDAGAVPVTNTGNAYAAGQIAAGSKSGTSSAVTGYREVFYGTVTSKGEITSDIIRGLTKLGAKHSNGRAIDILCPVGAMRVILAFPASCRDLQSIKDRNGLNAEAITSFATTQIDVEGANGYTAAAYKVYYLDFANANDTVNHYDATL